MQRQKTGYTRGEDGTDIFYETFGEGLPLAFADGIGCDGYAWKYLWEYFGDSCRMIHYHFRGHGKSATPTDQNNLTIQDLCEDMVRVFDDNEVDKAILFGHSMGCQVIFEFYRMFPDRVMGLVPICGSYGFPLKTFHDNKLLDTIFPLVYTVGVLTPWMIKPVWKYLVPTRLAWEIAIRTEINGHLVDKKDFMPYLKHISKVEPRVFLKMLDHASKHTAEDMLEEIAIPTLIIAGENDTFTPGWLSEKMHQAIPDSELMVIPHGTHTAPIEMPQLINLRLEKYFVKHFNHPGVDAKVIK